MSLHFQSVIDDIDQDCDIAAGINEDGLNHFLATHHTVNYNPSGLSIYRGVGKVEDLGIEEWSYDISESPVIDLYPIQAAAEKSRLKWFRSIPELGTFPAAARTQLENLMNEEANIEIKLPKITLAVKFEQTGPTPPPPPISVDLALVALGRVTINDKDEFEFSAIEIRVDSAVEDAIEAALKDKGLDKKDTITSSNSTVCYPIDKLIKHLINSFLKARIEKFTVALPLPSPLSLFKGIAVGNLKTMVLHDTLVVCGEAVPNGVAEDDREAADDDEDRFNAPGIDGKNIFLALSIDFFHLTSSKFLNISKSDGGSDGNDLAEWKWSYWMRLSDKGPEFRDQDKIRFNVDFDGGGSAKARVKTHCGPLPWIGTRLRADLIPQNEYVEAQLRFSGRKLKLRANTRWSGVGIHPENWWDGLGWVLSAILSIVGTAIFSILDFALNFFKIPLAELPERFPGTQIPFSIVGFKTGFSSNRRLYAVELGLKFDP